jgi:hypothetical protein
LHLNTPFVYAAVFQTLNAKQYGGEEIITKICVDGFEIIEFVKKKVNIFTELRLIKFEILSLYFIFYLKMHFCALEVTKSIH